jgi:primosomal protein N' (replication factor Y) (superfamily II helicase)
LSTLQRQYLEVAVPRRLFRIFTYSIPEAIPGPWSPGMRVRVPFGREVLTGYILGVSSQPGRHSAGKSLRNIIARLDDAPIISADLLALTAWVADRYLAAPAECLRLVFPGRTEKQRRRSSIQPIHDPAQTFGSEVSALPPELAPFRDELVTTLGERRYAALLLPASTRDLVRLYREAIHTALGQNRSALVLVPETCQVEPLRRLLADGGQVSSEAYHGELSLHERQIAWTRIQRGEVRVVIGTRSAIFAPLVDLGLIMIDQEDHPAYKAENAPRYDARVVAAERARRLDAALVLASGHPSLEAVHATRNLAATWIRSEARTLPSVRIINLRDSPGEMLSAPLVDAIAERLATRRTALLFLNRKGYASVLHCRDCGQAIRCPTCGLGWTFHKKETVLLCAHCGRREAAPDACPACRSHRLFASGLGTEAAEEAVQRRFPKARLLRLERATGSKKPDAGLLARLRAKDYDILIATQFVLSAVPRPLASLIGILAPDAALHLPDFLAAERAYHTLREVMALASEHTSDAEVMIQTYMPEHHVIKALGTRDPWIFYKSELAARAALGYPPFGRLIGLRVSGIREEAVVAAAERWAGLLRAEFTKAVGEKMASAIQLLGPIPTLPARPRGRFRRQLIVKGEDGSRLRGAVHRTRVTMEGESRAGKLRYDVDVDPVSLLG